LMGLIGRQLNPNGGFSRGASSKEWLLILYVPITDKDTQETILQCLDGVIFAKGTQMARMPTFRPWMLLLWGSTTLLKKFSSHDSYHLKSAKVYDYRQTSLTDVIQS
jgi:hypothetical protein